LKPALISAITDCTEPRAQRQARRFLLGLSTDELQYIAEFLGSCVIECASPTEERIERFGCGRSAQMYNRGDQQHKMIVLLEYLRRSRRRSCVPASRAARG